VEGDVSFQEAMEAGELAEALRFSEAEHAAAPGPGTLFVLFELRAMLEDFAGARAALAELQRLAPEAAGGLREMEACVAASEECALRRTDAARAGRRAGLGPPPPAVLAAVQAAVAFAGGDAAAARRALDEGKAHATPTPGLLTTTGGAQLRFSDLVDADDLTGASLPLVGGPAVLDAAFAQVRRLRVVQAEGYQNQLWLPVELETQDGRQLAARLPALYPGSGRHEEPLVRIGRMTLWSHLEGVAVAYGQRDLKLISADGGCRMIGIWQVAELELDATASPARKGFFGRLFS